MDIVLIGAGNVAHFFGRIWQIQGHEIRQVVSRNLDHAKILGNILNAQYTNDWDDLYRPADLYLLAVNDKSLAALNNHLRLGKAMVAHTAGSAALQAIENISKNIGVMYPLQTINKEIISQPDFPILLEANNTEVLKRLQTLAESISPKTAEVNSATRLKLHLAAVFCNNFINHLFTLIKEYAVREGIEMQLVQPLLQETYSRLLKYDSREMQTGPAIRQDIPTLEAHRRLLTEYPALLDIYNLFSNEIEKYYKPLV